MAAGWKKLASRERTPIPEDHSLRRTVVTTEIPRSGLVQQALCRFPDYAAVLTFQPLSIGA